MLLDDITIFDDVVLEFDGRTKGYCVVVEVKFVLLGLATFANVGKVNLFRVTPWITIGNLLILLFEKVKDVALVLGFKMLSI